MPLCAFAYGLLADRAAAEDLVGDAFKTLWERRATGERWDRPMLHRTIEAETLNRVYLALNTLPPKCGQVFRLYYLQEKPLAEIAGELNLSLSTVKSQKRRALLLLKQRLGHLLSR